ncbi:class I SAM-dependent methyltransferase [Tautonia sp. JC769]|uniref:class I SAM-dependent methyltransferase n=1 Tax=Tautonia sp. JC769 TaxID=3232135 RepID=UPI003457B5BE
MIPPRLKPLILPLWNGGHRLAWRLGEYAGAIRHRRFDRCIICGRWGPKLYRRWVIRPELERRSGVSPTAVEAWARKESCDCPSCGAKLRARRIAEVLLSLDHIGSPPSPARSFRDWVASPEAQSLRVAEVNEIEGLHTFLLRLPHLSFSEFHDDAAPGALVDGVRCEHLERLTYPDASIDLLLTSETLEHVPDLSLALGEIRRVLRPGGRHVFTVPLLPGVPTTFPRARLRPDGSIEHLATPVSHPGGDWGYPVFTEFGADLPEILRDAGFEVDLRFGPVREDDVCQVFVCRKPFA